MTPAPPVLPIYVTATQARAIINAARRTRDRLLLETLWQSGARITEALGLHPADLLPAAGALHLLNEKQRRAARRGKTVFVSPDLIAQLQAHATDRRLPRDGYFFDGGDVRRPMGRQHAWRLVARASADAGVFLDAAGRPRPATPLDFRHGAAIHQLQAGVSLTGVQQQLGHARVDTTAGYLRLADAERRAMADRVIW